MVLARHPWNDTIYVFQPGAARRFSSVYVLFVNMLREVPGTWSSSSLIGQINRNIQGGNLVQGHSLENCGSHFSSPNSFTSSLTSGCCQPLGEMFAFSQYTEVPVAISTSFSSFIPVLPTCCANLPSGAIVEGNKRFHNYWYKKECSLSK